jgi:meso-butanediol dehydrogenase/(S,S)-butanediol dehydrogenase/diacetyl reductase
MRGLDGKRVLVTGGAGGIGSATCARFLQEGSRVVALDRDAAALDTLAVGLPGVEIVTADVTDAADVDRAFGEVEERWGGLDVVINNAGISIRHDFLDITLEEWHRVVDVVLHGVFYVAQRAARGMIAGGGVIVNMGSTNALAGYHHYADYNAGKAGVLSLTRSMALELAPTIRVNAVCPGFIMTPMQRAEYTDEMIARYEAKMPIGRLGEPEDIAAMFAFLGSDDASFITGATFVVDGGEIAGGLASQA